jgi:dipeptidyl aminopeptidase/acylaminoacyl peptidase
VKTQLSASVLLILSFALAGHTAEKRAFQLEDLYRVQSVASLQLSPDGKSAVFTVSTSDLGRAKRVTHIWQMDIDGKNQRQLTFGDKSETNPAFSPDGKWISFLSAREGGPALYLLPVAGGEAKRLLTVSTGISDPVWAPDSKSIAFAGDVYPECGADDSCNKKISDRWEKGPLQAHMADSLLYRHWTSWKDGTRTHILLASVEDGKVRDLTPGDADAPPFQLGGAVPYDFSPDGSKLVYASNPDKVPAVSTNSDLWLLSLNDPAAKPKNITAANPAYDGSPKFSPDGKIIAYRMQKQPGFEADLFRLAVYDLSSGTSKVLTESFRNWVEDFEWAEDSRSIYFAAPSEGQTPIYRIHAGTSAITQVLADKAIDGFTLLRNNSGILYIRRSTGEPAEIFRANLAGGKAAGSSRLSRFNQGLEEEVDLRPAESIWVAGAGGTRIQVFIVKPHGFDPSRKYPLILNVHGGPQMQWTDSFRGDWQVYPGAGYIVAFPNPHGSTGYGQDFTAEISGDWGGMVYEDVMKVTDALEKLPYVDPARIGAMGWSYGGYMMNWIEGHTNRYKAIVSMMGVYNLTAMHGATEELWFPEWDLKGHPWDSSLYEKWSPNKSVKNFKTPCLVITGERDYRVPYTQSLELFTDLQKMGVPSGLIVYSDAGHWPSWYEMALYYTAHLEWFQKYLGGGAPPWSSQDFLRNAVFDKETGKRIEKK